MDDEFNDATSIECLNWKDSGEKYVHSGLKYRLIEKIGSGGMGEVWKAERTTEIGHQDLVAIKFVKKELSQDFPLTRYGRAQAQEALLVSQLQDDNICRFLDAGYTNDGDIFIVMDYVEGTNLREFMDLHGLTLPKIASQQPAYKIPDKIAGFIMLMAGRALVYAQNKIFEDGTQGLLHRDISPDNYIISEETGAVKQIDFGVAIPLSKLQRKEGSHQFELFGKLFYMSPEALKEEEVDLRSDLFSLGIVAYELVTGINPQDPLDSGGSFFQNYLCLVNTLNAPILPPSAVVESVDPSLDDLIFRLTRADKDERPSSASDATRLLFEYLYPQQKTVGVTRESLRTYLKHIKNPSVSLTKHEKNCFDFLKDETGEPPVLQPYRIRPAALKKLRKGINPCRES